MASIDEIVKSKFPDNKHRLIGNLVFTAAWFKNLFTESLKPYDLSMQQFNILRILRGAKDWVAMNDVKNLMIEKSPNATRLADKMIAKGLIERKRSETDRRVVFINITKKGLDLLDVMDEDENTTRLEFLDKITEAEAAEVCRIFDKLRE